MTRYFGLSGEDGGGVIYLARENETLEQFYEWYIESGTESWCFFQDISGYPEVEDEDTFLRFSDLEPLTGDDLETAVSYFGKSIKLLRCVMSEDSLDWCFEIEGEIDAILALEPGGPSPGLSLETR